MGRSFLLVMFVIAAPLELSAAADPDPPEPVAPVIECNVQASPVYCEDGAPTLTALQRGPFELCRAALPGKKTLLGGTGRLFSATRTRTARKTRPGACCYVEWTWSACD